MREAAKVHQLKIGIAELDKGISASIPYADLIWALRVYDFHRMGLSLRRRISLLGRVTVPPATTSTVTFGPLYLPTFSITNSDGSNPQSEFFLWAPPFAQVRPGEPPVHVLAALTQYLEALAPFVREFDSLGR